MKHINKFNENVAFAKSILAKKRITQNSQEWQDYQKIRQICGSDNGYVGILTKIRFIDGITDFDEIKSIFDILKNSKIDITKMNKMSYSEILDIFYDELSGDKIKNKDYELIYKDSQYYYYKIYTYEGILKMGSPTWCLKTKKNWNEYQEKYQTQWVVIHHKYNNKLISPENNYLSEYKSTNGWVRYGISIHENEDDTFNYVAFNDNNIICKYETKFHTFFGILSTILNLKVGIKESYYDRFLGCQSIEGCKYLKIIDKDVFLDRINLKNDRYKDFEIYVKFSESYSSTPVLILLDANRPITAYTIHDKNIKFAIISGKESKKIFEKWATEHKNEILYFGIRLQLKLMNIDEIKSHPKFIKLVDDKWAIFNRNENYFLVINITNTEYQVPCMSIDSHNSNMDDPMYFYIDKKTLLPIDSITSKPMGVKDFQNPIIEEVKIYLNSIQNKTIEEPKKKISKFWNFPKK